MSIVEMKVPTIGESINEVTLSQWLKADGDFVELDEPICEFESDKATLEFPAEASGKLIHVAAEDDDLEIGALVAKIDTSVEKPSGGGSDKEKPKDEAPQDKEKSEKPEPEEKEEGKSADSAPESTDKGAPDKEVNHPSPSAGKILREKGIDPADVKGSGKDGRITKEDATKAEKPAAKKQEASKPKHKAAAPRADFSREEHREKMSRMRRTIAKRLVSAKNTTAMLTTFNEADMTEIFRMRKTYQEQFVKKYGIKLGFMSLFAKACAQALLEMPDVNAHIDGEELIYHDYVDISIAISTPNGLVVPPVKNVESMKLHEIEFAIKELAEKARDGSLSLEEMQGGTFTITNGGIFGSMMSTPILNEPQSAILGMHNIQQRPIAIDGQVVIRPMMYLALSYDHRVIDGSTSVTFLVRVKELLEDPARMFLEV